MSKIHINVSVVITTIGEKNLSTLVKDLLKGSRIPKEIIVVYPPDYNFHNNKIIKDVILLKSKVKGQVYQRKIQV